MEPLTTGIERFKNARIRLQVRPNDQFFFLDYPRDYFSVVFAVEGSGILQTAQGRIPFSTPAVLLIDEKETVSPVLSNGLKDMAIYFHPSVVNDSLTIPQIHDKTFYTEGTLSHDVWLLRRLFAREQGPVTQLNVALSITKKLITLFEKTGEQFSVQPDPFWPCRGRSYLLEILILIERLLCEQHVYKEEFSPSPELEEISPVLTYLHGSYTEKITINDLANRFNTNRTTLTERFIAATGFTPINYLIKLRIRIASTLLQDTSTPITEIIFRTGFEDLTHFGRTFKKNTGVAPSEFRKRFTVPAYLKG